jgi:hypothetical protein
MTITQLKRALLLPLLLLLLQLQAAASKLQGCRQQPGFLSRMSRTTYGMQGR